MIVGAVPTSFVSCVEGLRLLVLERVGARIGGVLLALGGDLRVRLFLRLGRALQLLVRDVAPLVGLLLLAVDARAGAADGERQGRELRRGEAAVRRRGAAAGCRESGAFFDSGHGAPRRADVAVVRPAAGW
jgi:hypothetical protein